ncbi:hypothetical protein AB3M75_07455 [Serratia ureilytica]|uniref:hypothetical protein n=1 Tax=Serratia ureilytica TaxID=300181 RepID=UPI00371C4BC6
MPSRYGIQLINDKNYVVANTDDVNYTLRAAGQIHNASFAPPFAGSLASSCAINLDDCFAPIVFFKPMNADQRICCMPGDDRDWISSQIPTKKWNRILKWANKNVGAIQYYVFDRWIPPERSAYGLQISNAQGGIIFDSGWNFMKVNSVLWLDPGYPNKNINDPEGGNWTVVGSAGSGNLAMAMPNPRGYIVDGTSWSGSNGYMLYECFHFSDWDNKITVSLVPRGEYLWTAPKSGWANPNTRSQIMVIDVDGLPTNYYDRTIIKGFTS